MGTSRITHCPKFLKFLLPAVVTSCRLEQNQQREAAWERRVLATGDDDA
jgi:hypothetical protein